MTTEPYKGVNTRAMFTMVTVRVNRALRVINVTSVDKVLRAVVSLRVSLLNTLFVLLTVLLNPF